MKARIDYNFRTAIVEEVVGESARRFFVRAGAYVRGVVRKMIKHRRNPEIHSEPGTPPIDHFGIRESILWASDKTGAVIGPKLIRGNSLNNVARLHEFGGERVAKDIDPQKWDGFKVGQIGPVTEHTMHREAGAVRREGKRDPATGRTIAWIRIKNKKQAEYATSVYRRFMAKHAAERLVRYPARPYMLPALEKSLPHLPGLWKSFVK